MDSENSDLCFYWINMDESIERRNYMEKLFIDNPNRNVRVPAISIPENRVFGCLSSHMLAIQKFYDSGEKVGIICEDDLSFEYKQYWKKSLNEVVKNAPVNWEIIQLEIIVKDNDILNIYFKRNNINYLGHHKLIYSTGCYVINRKGAETLLKLVGADYLPKIQVAEYILFRYATTYIYKYPMFTYKDDNDSTIHPEHLDEHERSKNMVTEYLIDSMKIK